MCDAKTPSSAWACVPTLSLLNITADRAGPACSPLYALSPGVSLCVSQPSQPVIKHWLFLHTVAVDSRAKLICFLQLLHPFQLQRHTPPSAPSPSVASLPSTTSCAPLPLHPSIACHLPSSPQPGTCPAVPSLSSAGIGTTGTWSPAPRLSPGSLDGCCGSMMSPRAPACHPGLPWQ